MCYKERIMKNFYSKFTLKKKTILVVGGSGQLGVKTIEILINAGANILNLDIFDKKKFKNKNYTFYKCDITNEIEVKKTKNKINKKFKSINALINHSHYKGDPKNLRPFHGFFSKVENYSTDIWKKTIDVNLNGLFFTTRSFLPMLLKNKRSVILNTSSTYGKVSPNKSIYGNSGINSPIGYATTKSAIIGFTKYLACHYGDRGLRANILIPGGISNSKQKSKFKKNYAKLTPLGKMSDNSDYMETVLFMVSDASSYMTGAEVVVDGGFTSW